MMCWHKQQQMFYYKGEKHFDMVIDKCTYDVPSQTVVKYQTQKFIQVAIPGNMYPSAFYSFDRNSTSVSWCG